MSNDTYTESWLVGPQSTKFYTRTYLPPSQQSPKAALVFVHGFAEHIARYAHFHPLLAARGIAVFAFDQRGYGLTAQDTKGNKSKGSSYGKSSWKEQMEDIAWAVEHAKETFKEVPLFLMGHSMGGGEVLGFACQGSHVSVLKSLSGIIATSPLILQTYPAGKPKRVVGGLASNVLPGLLIAAEVKAEHLSHDPAVFAAYKEDPLVRMQGSLKGLHDMLSKGEWLLNTGHEHWPQDVPVCIIHGTEDQVASCKASQAFHDKLAEGVKKKIHLFEGGYHELQNEPDGVKEKLAETITAHIEERVAVGESPVAAEPVVSSDAEAGDFSKANL